ncbi:MAG: TIGR03067 domain-containing protein, partial [Planctomycetia bacterium]
DRFSTPEEVAKALEPFCAGHDLTDLLARAESQTAPAHTLPRPASGGRFRRVMMVLLLMAFTGGLGLWGGIVLTIEHNGKKTSVEFPDNTEKVKVDQHGNMTARLGKTDGSTLSEKEQEIQKLVGTWKLVSVTEGNRLIPDQKPDSPKLVINDKTITWNTEGMGTISLKIDVNENPKRIQWPPKVTPYSIYKIEGNRLTIRAPEGGQKTPPTDFTPTTNERMLTFVFEKEFRTASRDNSPGNTTTAAGEHAIGDVASNYWWTPEQIEAKLAAIEKAPYALIVFSQQQDTKSEIAKTADLYTNYVFHRGMPEETQFLYLKLPHAEKIAKRFRVEKTNYYTYVFLKNGKEVFRNTIIEFEKHLLPHLPPLKVFPHLTLSKGRSKIKLKIENQPNQSSRWSGKTLQVTWPAGLEVVSLTKGYQNFLNDHQVEWPISGQIPDSQRFEYEIEFWATTPYSKAEFRANLLDKDGNVAWTTSKKIDIEVLTDSMVKPPKKPNKISKTDQEWERLVGTWKPIHNQHGKKILTNATNVIIPKEIVIRKGVMTLFLENRVNHTSDTIERTFTIDVTANPKRMMMQGRGPSHAIYKLEGDRLTICAPIDANIPSPASFDVVGKSDKALYSLNIFERVKTPSLQGASAENADLKKLLGTWKVISLQDSGKEYKEDFNDAKLTIDPDFIELTGLPEEEGEDRIGKIPLVLDATANPKRISWPYSMENYSIYKLTGDRLMICFPEGTQWGHPTEFISKPKSPNDVLFIFERVKVSETANETGKKLHRLVYRADQASSDPASNDKIAATVAKRVQLACPLWKIQLKGNLEFEVLITNEKPDPQTVQRIDDLLGRPGTLEFRVLANHHDHDALIKRAKKEKGDRLLDKKGKPLAWWVPVDEKRTKDIAAMSEYIVTRKVGSELQVLVVNDQQNVTDKFLESVSATQDHNKKPAVLFAFNKEGAQRFGKLTGDNTPDDSGITPIRRKLGIILDGRLYSAPNIMSRIMANGIINGDFTE